MQNEDGKPRSALGFRHGKDVKVGEIEASKNLVSARLTYAGEQVHIAACYMPHGGSKENCEETAERWMRFANTDGPNVIGGDLDWYGTAFMQEHINGSQMHDDLKTNDTATTRDWRIFDLTGGGHWKIAQPTDGKATTTWRKC